MEDVGLVEIAGNFNTRFISRKEEKVQIAAVAGIGEVCRNKESTFEGCSIDLPFEVAVIYTMFKVTKVSKVTKVKEFCLFYLFRQSQLSLTTPIKDPVSGGTLF